jgi:hypothetical protein
MSFHTAWVISGQTISRPCRSLSALVQKRTNADAVGLSAWRELDLVHAENLTAPGSAQLHLAIRWPESQKRAKNFYQLKKHRKLAVPRVVPQPSDFNNLQCQTALSALTGAKGIFLRCQTGKFTTQNVDVYEPRAMSAIGAKRTSRRRVAMSALPQSRRSPATRLNSDFKRTSKIRVRATEL